MVFGAVLPNIGYEGLFMNINVFTGYICDDLILNEEDGASVIEFDLVTYEYRRSRATGEKTRIPTYIRCEAWSTGAEVIHKLGRKGSKITISASAKNIKPSDNGSSTDLIFRINKFDFANTENE